jgi:hypothetical protein
MPSPEQPADTEPPSFYFQAARFSGERPAGRAYLRAQEAIRSTECDVSVFRLLLVRTWHVAVLGQAPPETLDRSLRRILATGEPTSLLDDILKLLWERRAQAIKLSPWVERHIPPPGPEH